MDDLSRHDFLLWLDEQEYPDFWLSAKLNELQETDIYGERGDNECII